MKKEKELKEMLAGPKILRKVNAHFKTHVTMDLPEWANILALIVNEMRDEEKAFLIKRTRRIDKKN